MGFPLYSLTLSKSYENSKKIKKGKGKSAFFLAQLPYLFYDEPMIIVSALQTGLPVITA